MQFQNLGVVLNKNGVGVGSALLDDTFRSGSSLAVAGVRFLKLRLHTALDAATGIVVRLVDVSPSSISALADPRPLQGVSQADTAQTKAAFTFTAADDCVLYDIGGVCELVAVQVKATGAGPFTAGDVAQVEVSIAQDGR